MGPSIKLEFDNQFFSELRQIVQEEVSKTHIKPIQDEPLSINQTAKLFGVTVQTIYAWIKKEQIPSKVIGGRRYFFLSEIRSHLENTQIVERGE